MQNIPLTDTPRQAITTLLGGQRVTMNVWWQPLSEAWYVTLDFGDDRVATARQVIPWERIIGPAELFAGDLLVLAGREATDAPLGRTAWTTTHALWYLTADELTAARL